MAVTGHRTFRFPVPVREYGYTDDTLIPQPGSPSGFLLPWDAIEDQAQAVSERRPPAYVVIGEFTRADGMRFPELGVTTAYIEASSDYRWDQGRLRVVCRCSGKDGKHAKDCDR